jgi:hypothetical protein
MAEVGTINPFTTEIAAYREWMPYGVEFARNAGRASLALTHEINYHRGAHGGGHEYDAETCLPWVVASAKDCFPIGDPARMHVAGLAIEIRDGTLGAPPDESAYADPGWAQEQYPNTDEWTRQGE